MWQSARHQPIVTQKSIPLNVVTTTAAIVEHPERCFRRRAPVGVGRNPSQDPEMKCHVTILRFQVLRNGEGIHKQTSSIEQMNYDEVR